MFIWNSFQNVTPLRSDCQDNFVFGDEPLSPLIDTIRLSKQYDGIRHENSEAA